MYRLTPLIRLYLIARCPPSTVVGLDSTSFDKGEESTVED